MNLATITTTHFPADQPCPACQNPIDACTGTSDLTPGAPILCAYCTVYLTITEAGTLRILTNREWLALSPEFRRFLAGVRDRYRAEILT